MVSLFCHGDLPILMCDPSGDIFLEQEPVQAPFCSFRWILQTHFCTFIVGGKQVQTKCFHFLFLSQCEVSELHGRGLGHCKVQSSTQDLAIACRSFQFISPLKFESHQFKGFKYIEMSSWVLSCSFESWWPLWIPQSSAQKPASE